MAVRFLCPSCSQPIEVDDDLALKVVACPYCRKTITAPAASTFVDPPQVPVAAALRGAQGAGMHGRPGASTSFGAGQARFGPGTSSYDSTGAGSAGASGPIGSGEAGEFYAGLGPYRNRLAVVAFGLACGVVLLAILAAIVYSNHRIEFEELVKSLNETGGGLAGQWKALSDLVDRHGGVPPQWLYALALLNMGALGTCVAAIVCAIIALRRPVRRGFALAALIICSLFLLLSCAGSIVG